MGLCGVDYSLHPPFWPPVLVASLIYLVPVLIPWRRVSIGIWGVSVLLVGLMVFSTFVVPDIDICDPPYSQALMRDMTLAAIWALGVVTYALRRPLSGAVPVFAGYLVAIIPALLLLAL